MRSSGSSRKIGADGGGGASASRPLLPRTGSQAPTDRPAAQSNQSRSKIPPLLSGAGSMCGERIGVTRPLPLTPPPHSLDPSSIFWHISHPRDQPSTASYSRNVKRPGAMQTFEQEPIALPTAHHKPGSKCQAGLRSPCHAQNPITRLMRINCTYRTSTRK